jgi:alpha-glucoside transport system substrate-binding protein
MATIAGIGAVALVLTACGSSSSTASSNSSSSSPAAASAPAAAGSSAAPMVSPSAPASGAMSSGPMSSGPASSGTASAGTVPNDDATYCDTIKKTWPNISGKTVTVYSGVTGTEGTAMGKSFDDFTKCSGATVKNTADKNFETQILVQAKSGNAPDIAIVPQPGLLAQLVATGKVVKPPAAALANITNDWKPSVTKYGIVNGTMYSVPFDASVKSLVWYSPKMFSAKGYTVPTTWDAMVALSDKIAADPDNIKPWCAGVESGTATGWTATDWLEEVVLRQAGPDVYDQWVAHTVKFSDPQIAKALATVGSIWKNPKYVNAGIGDVNSIVKTAFGDAGLPIQSGKCYMMQQASFYQLNFKNNPKFSPTGDLYAFYEPAMSDKFGKPVEIAGSLTTAFSDRPEVQAFQYYMSTTHYANDRATQSQWLSANLGLTTKSVTDPIQQLSLQILQDPKTVARFDASDQMPAAVGSAAEWTNLTAWITGQSDAATHSAIDAAWPAS